MSGRISVCPALTGSAVLNTYNYTFDGIGNRTDRNYAANTANQYKKNPDAANADIDYDPRGNMTTDGVFDFTWNSANQLTSAKPRTVVTLEQEATAHENGEDLPASRKVEFGYDDAGRRIWKKSYVYSSATSAWLAKETRKFVYDRNNLVADFVVDPNGMDRLSRTYAWGKGIAGSVGGLLSITTFADDGATPTATYIPLYDDRGNVVGLANASDGKLVAVYQYDPFGKLIGEAGDKAVLDANPFLFSTKYFDRETGLYDFGFRYYSPILQRWLTRDPIAESGGVNVYAFNNNDPINRVDPDGLEPFDADGRRIRPNFGNAPEGGVGGFDENGQYSYIDHMGRRMVPVIVCHGRNGQGRLPNLLLTDSFVDGQWYHSGSNGRIIKNFSSGVAGGFVKMALFLPATIGNMLTVAGRVITSPFDKDEWLVDLPFDENRAGNAVADWLYSTRDRHSLITTSGDIGGQILAVPVANKQFQLLLAPASRVSRAPILLADESFIRANAITSPGLEGIIATESRSGLSTMSIPRTGLLGVRSANHTFATMMEPAEAARYQAYWARQAAFEDMATCRTGLGGIPAKGGKLPDGGTLSRLDTGGSSFYGMSAHGQPTLIGNKFTYTHAEIDALQQAFMAGRLDASAVMYVDNRLCEFCQSGLPRTLRDLQMQELIIHDPANSWRITPSGAVKIGR